MERTKLVKLLQLPCIGESYVVSIRCALYKQAIAIVCRSWRAVKVRGFDFH